MDLTDADRALIAALAEGLPLVPEPWRALADRLGEDPAALRARLATLRTAGLIKRCGVIVRHRPLGYDANAMVVWDIPDDRVTTAGRALAAEPDVTLCYRRPRRPPVWPYNLFCMVHGRDRAEVEAAVAAMAARHGLAAVPRALLFSRRCFVQRGAQFARAA